MQKSSILGSRFTGLWFYICWSFNFLLFSLIRHLKFAIGRGALFLFSFSLSILTVAVDPYSRWVVFFIPEVFENCNHRFCVLTRVGFISCSDIVWVSYVIGLKVSFNTFEMINSWFGFSLRSFCEACSLGMPSLTLFHDIARFRLSSDFGHLCVRFLVIIDIPQRARILML